MEKTVRLTPRLAVQLAAPHTWVASVFPAVFGTVFSFSSGYLLHWLQSIALLLACIFMQSSVNTLNDYIDFIKGTDSAEENVEISDATLVYNNIKPKHAFILGLVYLAVGAVFGLFGCIQSGWLPIGIGVVGGLVVLIYSCGPLPISYLPLGEILSGIVMGGLIPLAITAAADGKWHGEVLFYSLPLILGIALIMMTNNGSDMEKDIHAKRHTLPALIGRKKTLEIYRLLIRIWFVLLCIFPILRLGLIGGVGTFFCLLIVRKVFCRLLHSELVPEKRIMQMKSIVKANIIGNGVYILTFVAQWMVEIFHG